MAAAFDIAAAYRITPTKPTQQHVLCLSWRNKVFVDRAVSFGMASSAGVFGKVADLLVAIYKATGIEKVLKWVDDFFVVRLPGESWSERDFIEITRVLGVPWALDKTKLFAIIQRFIGFDWDLKDRSVALPAEKLDTVKELISQWLAEDASRFSHHDAARLHGKLVHCSSIFPLIRPFLPSISRFATSFKSERSRLRPPQPLLTDLSWIHMLLMRLPNKLPLSATAPLDIQWWGDASTSFGIGVTVGSFWGVWQWQSGFRVGPGQAFDIGWAEAVAVELGLLMAFHHGLITSRPAHTAHFLVRSDNEGVVAVIKKGRSRSRTTNEVLQRIYLTLADLHIHLSPLYVPSRDNVTDALSRGNISAFLAAFPFATVRSGLPLPSHLADKLCSIPSL